jgi:terminase small subunit / prophage DNA-packing protein
MSKGHDFGEVLNRTQLAARFGCSLPTVDAMVRRGLPYLRKPEKRGVGEWQFDWLECDRWRFDQREAEIRGEYDTQTEATTLDEARRQLVVTQTRQAELQLAKDRGELVAIADVEQYVTDMISNARAKLIGIPSKLAPIVATKTKQAECKDIIEGEINEALVELSAYSATDGIDDFDSLDRSPEIPGSNGAGGEPVETAAETHGKPVGRPRKAPKRGKRGRTG